jgi:hypothetical protein
MTSWRTRWALTCVHARTAVAARTLALTLSACAFCVRTQPPLSLERIIAINKELTQLSPVVEAFEALRELEAVRTVTRAQPSTKAHTRSVFLLLTAGGRTVPRAQEIATLDEVVATAGDDAEMRALAEEARNADHTHPCTHAAVAEAAS